MTREERHIAVLNRMLESMDVYDSIQPTTERKKAIKAAIQALSQEPTVQDKQAESEKYQKAFDDGYANGYEQARFDYEQEPCDDAVSRQAVKVWLEEMDNKLNPEKYNTIAEYYAVKAQMQKLIYICDIPKEKSCLNCKYNNENLYRGEHCGDCDECMLWEQEEQLPPVTPKQKTGKWEWVQYDYNPKLGNWNCSECRSVVIECVGKEEKGGIPLYKYCPQCGAKMQESEDKVRNETDN